MHFNNTNELAARGYVEVSDTLDIRWRDNSYRLIVMSNYIQIGAGYNVSIIRDMAKLQGTTLMDKMSFLYGYKASSGEWPYYNSGDLKAAYHALLWVCHMCKTYGHNTQNQIANYVSATTGGYNPFNIGDVVQYGGASAVYQGRVMKIDGHNTTIAWYDGRISIHSYTELRVVRSEKEDISKTKYTYNEHLQKQNLPDQGSEGNPGIGISDRGSSTAVGSRYHGYEACLSESYQTIRSGKIRGTAIQL